MHGFRFLRLLSLFLPGRGLDQIRMNMLFMFSMIQARQESSAKIFFLGILILMLRREYLPANPLKPSPLRGRWRGFTPRRMRWKRFYTLPDGDIHLCSSTYFVRLPLTRELSSVSETEGETEFLQHPKRAIFSLSLRLFAVQKSTSLVRGRLALAVGLCVIRGAMWASPPTQKLMGKQKRRER